MDNRARFKHLLELHGIPQTSKDKVSAARIIGAVTGRPCSDRTVRTWLADPLTPSSRPCPDWALAALVKGIGYMKRAVEPAAEA